MRSPYSVLGLKQSAKDDDIKSAYRKLAKVWHPDQNPDNSDAANVFAEINNAYHLLIDTPRRKLFDAGKIDANGRRRKTRTVHKPDTNPYSKPKFDIKRAKAKVDTPSVSEAKHSEQSIKSASKESLKTQTGQDDHGDQGRFVKTGFSDMISHIFGSEEERVAFDKAAKKNARERSDNFHRSAMSELDDAFTKFQKHRQAPSDDTFRAPDRQFVVEVDLADIFTGVTVPIQPERKNSLNVHVPAGTMEGDKIVIEGMGDCRKGETPGDVVVTIKYRPNEKFWIRNGELHTHLVVDLADAVLGGEVTTNTPEGPATFRLPEWTSSNHIIRIPKRGLPTQSGERGDLCANVCILLPEKQDEALKHVLRQNRRSWFI